MNTDGERTEGAAEVRVTLGGNATVLIECGETQIITDPWLGEQVGPWRRWRPAALAPGDLRNVAAVLISHAHADHFHLPSLRAVPRDRPVLTPGGPAARCLERAGFGQVFRLREWERWTGTGLAVTAVPSVHCRKSLGYVVELAGRRIYFAGDAGPRTPFGTIRKRCGPLDVALLPIGGSSLAVGPFQRHLTPPMAAEAAAALAPRLALPIHWGHVPCVPAALDRFRGNLEAFRAAMERLAPGIPVRFPEDGQRVAI
jgi:L-ascorbate metabolism protein UlaG (beta-lactamase superfamily)